MVCIVENTPVLIVIVVVIICCPLCPLLQHLPRVAVIMR